MGWAGGGPLPWGRCRGRSPSTATPPSSPNSTRSRAATLGRADRRIRAARERGLRAHPGLDAGGGDRGEVPTTGRPVGDGPLALGAHRAAGGDRPVRPQLGRPRLPAAAPALTGGRSRREKYAGSAAGDGEVGRAVRGRRHLPAVAQRRGHLVGERVQSRCVGRCDRWSRRGGAALPRCRRWRRRRRPRWVSPTRPTTSPSRCASRSAPRNTW